VLWTEFAPQSAGKKYDRHAPVQTNDPASTKNLSSLPVSDNGSERRVVLRALIIWVAELSQLYRHNNFVFIAEASAPFFPVRQGIEGKIKKSLNYDIVSTRITHLLERPLKI